MISAGTCVQNSHHLLVALSERLRLPLSECAQILLTTEGKRYSVDRHQPTRDGDSAYFDHPAAIDYLL